MQGRIKRSMKRPGYGASTDRRGTTQERRRNLSETLREDATIRARWMPTLHTREFEGEQAVVTCLTDR